MDGVSPSFEYWRIQIKDKFLVNSYIFDFKQAKMAYIFNYMASTAQKHLALRYRKGLEPFTTSSEMITHLAKIFENPLEAQDAYTDFYGLAIEENKPFSDFYMCFLYLAAAGNVPIDDLQPSLYEKLSPALQQLVLPFLDTLSTSKALAQKCLFIDKRRGRQ